MDQPTNRMPADEPPKGVTFKDKVMNSLCPHQTLKSEVKVHHAETGSIATITLECCDCKTRFEFAPKVGLSEDKLTAFLQVKPAA